MGRAQGELVPLRGSQSTGESSGFPWGRAGEPRLRGTLGPSSVSAGSSVLGETLPADLSLLSRTVLEGSGRPGSGRPGSGSPAQLRSAVPGSQRQPGEEREASHLSTAATGRPGIAPHGRRAHTQAHTPRHTSHPWDQVQTFGRKRHETAQSGSDLQGLFGLS